MARLLANRKLRRWLARQSYLPDVSGRFWDMLACGFWTLGGMLPARHAAAIGGGIMGRLGPHSGKRDKVRQNLRIAFPEMNAEERAGIERQIWANLGRVLGEYPHLGQLARPVEQGGAIEVNIPDHLKPNFDGLKPCIYTTAHLANWELLAGAPNVWGMDLAVVYAPIGDGASDRWLRQYREAMGARLIPRDRSALGLLRHIRRGGSVGIVADHRDDTGDALPFFGHTKRTSLGPARLALMTGADLVPVRVVRTAPDRYRFDAVGPITPPEGCADDDERARAMMTAFNRQLEVWIRERPFEWQCGKRAFDKRLIKTLERRAEQRGSPELAGMHLG